MAPVALQAGAVLRPGLEDAVGEGLGSEGADGRGSIDDVADAEASGVGDASVGEEGVAGARDGVGGMDRDGWMDGVGETGVAALTAGDAVWVVACAQEAVMSAAIAASEISRNTRLLLDVLSSPSTTVPDRMTVPGILRAAGRKHGRRSRSPSDGDAGMYFRAT